MQVSIQLGRSPKDPLDGRRNIQYIYAYRKKHWFGVSLFRKHTHMLYVALCSPDLKHPRARECCDVSACKSCRSVACTAPALAKQKKNGNKTGASKNDPENKKMEDHRRSWKKSLWNDHLWSMMVSWNVLDVISSARSTKNKSFPACQTSVHPQSGRVAGLTCWEILYRHPLHFAQKEWDGNPSACSCPRLQFVQPQPAWAGVETRVPKISETTPKTPQYGIMKVPDRSVHE